MVKFRILLCLLFFAPLISHSQDNANDSLGNPFEDIAENLQKTWRLDSIQDQNAEDVYILGEADILHLGEDGFTFVIESRNVSTSGIWECSPNPAEPLVLKQALGADTSNLDSSIYLVVNGSPVLVYFKEGKEVVRLAKGRVVSSKYVENFKILALAKNSLTLERDGETYYFTSDESGDTAPVEVEQSGPYKSEGFSFESIWRGMLGIVTLLAIAVAFSSNRRAISWSLVGKGLLIQLIFALLVLKVPAVTFFFEIVSGFFIQIISFTQEGTAFLFESFVTHKIESSLINFVIMVLPTIVFFAALTSLLYYWGVLQK
ncbi:MAG: hypothetical protein COB85_08435, partial [Bacteroidetes bacterium]